MDTARSVPGEGAAWSVTWREPRSQTIEFVKSSAYTSLEDVSDRRYGWLTVVLSRRHLLVSNAHTFFIASVP